MGGERWPDEQFAAAAPRLGLAFLELLSAQSRWVHRRVETIDLLRREVVRRSVSVDFTIPEPLEGDLRLGARSGCCVPLGVLDKRPLANFDLREDDPVPLLGAEQNARIATEVLTAALLVAVDGPFTVSPAVGEALAGVARAPAGRGADAIDRLLALGAEEPELPRALEDARLRYFLASFAQSFLLVAAVDGAGARHIVKFAYDDEIRPGPGPRSSRHRLVEWLGWGPVLLDVDVPGARDAPSYHAEVVVPEELRIDAALYDRTSGRLLSTQVERDVDRAGLHAPGVGADSDPVASVAVRAERAGAPTLAVAVSAVTTALLLIGGTAADLAGATAGTSATVLLAGSAVFASLLTRANEHRLVRQVLQGVRFMLAAVAVAALAGAAAVGFGADEATRSGVWLAAAVVAGLGTASLAVSYRRAA